MTWNSRQGRAFSARIRVVPALFALAAAPLLYATGRQIYQLFVSRDAAPRPAVADVPTAGEYSLTWPFLLSLLPYLAAIIVLSCLCLRLLLRLRRAGRASGGETVAAGPQSGASVAEFIIAFPFLLALLLAILQIALLVQAKFVVNYAAFCAVRSAIVTIPARIRSGRNIEERNVIHVRNPDSGKMKIIRRAAALPCTAISPVWRPGLIGATGTSYNPSAVGPLSRLTVFAPSLDYERQVLSRALYAYDRRNTDIEVAAGAGDHAPVTVKVTHRYYLAVPFANRVFGRGYFGGALGLLGFESAWYFPITEQYTLLKEGEPLYPDVQKGRFGNSDVEIERH